MKCQTCMHWIEQHDTDGCTAPYCTCTANPDEIEDLAGDDLVAWLDDEGGST